MVGAFWNNSEWKNYSEIETCINNQLHPLVHAPMSSRIHKTKKLSTIKGPVNRGCC